MFRLSKLVEKLELKVEHRWKSWFARHKEKLPIYIPAVLIGWYFYGMFLNSLQLGIASTFQAFEEPIESIWVFDPFRNLFAIFSRFGIVATLVIILRYIGCTIPKWEVYKLKKARYSISVVATVLSLVSW